MTEKNCFHKFADFWEDYKFEFLVFLCTAIVSIFSIIIGFKNHWIFWSILIIAIALSFLFQYKSYVKAKTDTQKNETIKNQAEKIQLLESTIEKIEGVNYKLFQYVLISLFTKLGLDSSDRISIYKKIKDRFVIMSRYSINPEFESINRKHYPISEGFIGVALQKGDFFINNLPEFVHSKKESYYNIVQKNCNIDKETLRNMKMKSRSFYCKALTDAAGIERRAVIVFESMSPNKLDKEELLKVLQIEEHKLVAFIDNVRLRLPDIDTIIAQENGF